MKSKNGAIEEKVALQELTNFLNIHLMSQVKEEEVKEDYPILLKAVESGNLILNEEPVYKLTQPLKGEESQEVILEEVKFKTRIKPSQLANLSRGLNLSKDSFQYALACTAFIISQPKGFLDKFNKRDYTVIQQLSAVFL